MNHAELVTLLQGVNVAAVAKAADVSEKTIYRIRQSAKPGREPYLPTMANALAIRDAVQAMKRAAKPRKAKAQEVAQ